jgi:cytochrome c-type biogenesis protein CcmH/NrfG
MAKKPEKISGYVTIFTAIIIGIITFFIGYLTGSVVTVYRSGTPTPGMKAPAQNTELIERIKALEEQARKNPQDVNALVSLGHAYFDSDKYEKAIDAYQKALVLKPNDPNIITDMGVMYRRNRQPKKAVQAFERAIGADPKHEIARFNKGIVLLHDLEDLEGAIEAWEGLLKINPLAKTPSGQSLADMVKHYKAHGQEKKK